MTPKPIGRAKGPGQKTFEFEFITSDKEKVRIGEFVYYNYIDPINKNKKLKVLSRVIHRSPLRLYPDVMLSDATLDPKVIADTIGFANSEEMDFYSITAQIIGYYKDNNFKFVNPRLPPFPGDEIYLAEGKDLESWINPFQENESRSAYIGNLITRTTEQVKICLDINKIVSTHMAILAATGSGKSYTVGVLLEEMMKPKNKAAVLVIDPHAEYNTLKQIEVLSEFEDSKGYKPIVKILDSQNIHIKLSTLNFNELLAIMKNVSDRMRLFFRVAYNDAKKKNPNFTLADLENNLENMRKTDGKDSTTIQAVKWRLTEFLKNREIIDEVKHIYLREILKPGQLTIMNVSDMIKDDQQIAVSVFLRRILNSRISITQEKIGKKSNLKDEDRLDYPVFIVLEEGHRFAPAREESWSKNVLKTILSEGRKFGIGICIVSQRPSKLDSDILSQCLSQIILKIKSPADQKNIRDSLESVSEDIIEELPGLTMGQAVIAGECINTPVLINIRNRLTKHGGQSLNSVEEWLNYKPPPPKKIALPSNQDEDLD
ncbi:MAG: ATP-binding protein [Promethearchaeota archaeon]